MKCPPIAEWPPEVMRYLERQLLIRYLAPMGGEKSQLACERLLCSTYAGQIVESRGQRRLVPHSVTAGQLYERACREAKEFLAAEQQAAATGETP
jgi:hypothetical protein